MLSYAVGSLLDAPEGVLIHGVNAAGAFGAGVAGAIAQRWPEVRRAYLEAHQSGRMTLGTVQWVQAAQGSILIANCVTQATYGRTGLHVDYDAVHACMRGIAEASRTGVAGTAWATGFGAIAMPKIGAGLAGGDWKRLETIIGAELADLTVTVRVLAPQDVPSWRRDGAERGPEAGP